VFSDPEPIDETDRGYFENAAPNDEAEVRAEAEARAQIAPNVAAELAGEE
jgi:hypothetical protein